MRDEALGSVSKENKMLLSVRKLGYYALECTRSSKSATLEVMVLQGRAPSGSRMRGGGSKAPTMGAKAVPLG